ncbi:unnamed protein product [Meganyctiphanes norvegica]|uniref:Uncharacterized protein n=1 Tax=Meganyctiphanes norvegica TaxID=48144 RepID=A0AAV2R661_MEGNR
MDNSSDHLNGNNINSEKDLNLVIPSNLPEQRQNKDQNVLNLVVRSNLLGRKQNRGQNDDLSIVVESNLPEEEQNKGQHKDINDVQGTEFENIEAIKLSAKNVNENTSVIGSYIGNENNAAQLNENNIHSEKELNLADQFNLLEERHNKTQNVLNLVVESSLLEGKQNIGQNNDLSITVESNLQEGKQNKGQNNDINTVRGTEIENIEGIRQSLENMNDNSAVIGPYIENENNSAHINENNFDSEHYLNLVVQSNSTEEQQNEGKNDNLNFSGESNLQEVEQIEDQNNDLNIVTESNSPEGEQNRGKINNFNTVRGDEFEKSNEPAPTITFKPICNIDICITSPTVDEKEENNGFNKSKGVVDIRALIQEETDSHHQEQNHKHNKYSEVIQNMVKDAMVDTGINEAEISHFGHDTIIFKTEVNPNQNNIDIPNEKEKENIDINNFAVINGTEIFNSSDKIAEIDNKEKGYIDVNNATAINDPELFNNSGKIAKMDNEKENDYIDVNNSTVINDDTEVFNNSEGIAEINNEEEITIMKNDDYIDITSNNLIIDCINANSVEHNILCNNAQEKIESCMENTNKSSVSIDMENKDKNDDSGICKDKIDETKKKEFDICSTLISLQNIQSNENHKYIDRQKNEIFDNEEENIKTDCKEHTMSSVLAISENQSEAREYENTNIDKNNVNINTTINSPKGFNEIPSGEKNYNCTDNKQGTQDYVESLDMYMDSKQEKECKVNKIDTLHFDDILETKLDSNSHEHMDGRHEISQHLNYIDNTKFQETEGDIDKIENESDHYHKEITENLENLMKSNDDISNDTVDNSFFKSSKEELNKPMEGIINWEYVDEDNDQNELALSSIDVDNVVHSNNIWAFENCSNFSTMKSSSEDNDLIKDVVNPNTQDIINADLKSDVHIIMDDSNPDEISNNINNQTLNDEFDIIEIDEISIGLRESVIDQAETSVSIEQHKDAETDVDTIESFSDYIERKTREIQEEQERKAKEQEEEKQGQLMRDLDVALERILRRMEETTSNNLENTDQYSLGIDDEIAERREELQEIINDGLMGIMKREQIEKRENVEKREHKGRRRGILKVQDSIPDVIPEEIEIDRIVELAINEMANSELFERDEKVQRMSAMQSLDNASSLDEDSIFDTKEEETTLKSEIRKIQKEFDDTFVKYESDSENLKNSESEVIKSYYNKLCKSDCTPKPINFVENRESEDNLCKIYSEKIKEPPLSEENQYKEASKSFEDLILEENVIASRSKANTIINEKEHFFCDSENDSRADIKENMEHPLQVSTFCSDERDLMVDLGENCNNKKPVFAYYGDKNHSKLDIEDKSEKKEHVSGFFKDESGLGVDLEKKKENRFQTTKRVHDENDLKDVLKDNSENLAHDSRFCDDEKDLRVDIKCNSENKLLFSELCEKENVLKVDLKENFENHFKPSEFCENDTLEKNVQGPNVCHDEHIDTNVINGNGRNYKESEQPVPVYEVQPLLSEERAEEQVFVSLGGKLSFELEKEEISKNGPEKGCINYGYLESEIDSISKVTTAALPNVNYQLEEDTLNERNIDLCLEISNNVKINTNELYNIDLEQGTSIQKPVRGKKENKKYLKTEEKGNLEDSLNNVKSIINSIKKNEDEYMLENRVENLNKIKLKKEKVNTNKDRENTMQNCIIYIKDDKVYSTDNETDNSTRFKEAGIIINGVRKDIERNKSPLQKETAIEKEKKEMEEALDLNHYDKSCCKIC